MVPRNCLVMSWHISSLQSLAMILFPDKMTTTECFISPLSAWQGLYFHPLHHDIMVFHLFLSPWHSVSPYPPILQKSANSFFYFILTFSILTTSAWRSVPSHLLQHEKMCHNVPFYLSHITVTSQGLTIQAHQQDKLCYFYPHQQDKGVSSSLLHPDNI